MVDHKMPQLSCQEIMAVIDLAANAYGSAYAGADGEDQRILTALAYSGSNLRQSPSQAPTSKISAFRGNHFRIQAQISSFPKK